MYDPDTPLQEQASCAISASPYVDQRKLRLEAHDGRVTLRGTVNTYYQKQMAQEALRSVAGIEEIENELEVSWS